MGFRHLGEDLLLGKGSICLDEDSHLLKTLFLVVQSIVFFYIIYGSKTSLRSCNMVVHLIHCSTVYSARNCDLLRHSY